MAPANVSRVTFWRVCGKKLIDFPLFRFSLKVTVPLVTVVDKLSSVVALQDPAPFIFHFFLFLLVFTSIIAKN